MDSKDPSPNPWLDQRRAEARRRRAQFAHDTERPERRAAWKAVRAALKSGKLQRSSCQVQAEGICLGPKAPADFHHTHGYSVEHQLTGVWACQACHDHLARLEVARARKAAHRRHAEREGRQAGVLLIEE